MSISLTSVTLPNNSNVVTINSPSIDLTDANIAGMELYFTSPPLLLRIASGGNNQITLSSTYTGTALTAVAARVIETKAPLTAAVDNVNLLGQQMIATKEANQAIIDSLGTAANKDVTTSTTDTTANRLLKTGDFGIGGRAGPLATGFNLDTLYAGGNYAGYGGGHALATGGTNPFPTLNGAFTLYCTGSGASTTDQYLTQVAFRSNANTLEMKFRSKENNALGWSTWKDLYHSGNTNFNVFGVQAGRVLNSTGVGLSSTSVDFDLPVQGLTNPTSITTSGGFNIIDVITGVNVGSNVLPALAGVSHGKNATSRFTVAGAGGGRLYRAVAVSNSVITVNF